MTVSIRSHAKINLGLAIGPVRPDGYHALATIYQTLAIHDIVEITATRRRGGAAGGIEIACNDPRVPLDAQNTCWQIVERALKHTKTQAKVHIRIEKRLPVQGGLGAGSANAAAALLGLERELGLQLPAGERLALAAEVGSDVPLFLIGGTVLGLGRGEEVYPLPDLPETACVLAVPEISVSTPKAFQEWDRGQGRAGRDKGSGNRDQGTGIPPKPQAGLDGAPAGQGTGSSGQGTEIPHKPKTGLYGAPSKKRHNPENGPGGPHKASFSLCGVEVPRELTGDAASDRLKRLGRVWAAALAGAPESANATGVFPGVPREDRAGNLLLKLVRAGIENDFEAVVLPLYPSLRDILDLLKNRSQKAMVPQTTAPLYAALSGSGSALFGLYGTDAEAKSGAERLREQNIAAIETATIGRSEYWRRIWAID